MSQQKTVKVWTASKNAPAGFQVEEKAAYMIGSRSNFIAADGNGVSITGKSITLGTGAENVRRGGLFIGLNDFIKLIPTTIVTPMPEQIPFPPMGVVTGVMKDLPFFIAMLNTLG
jgi:hypothetical protein